MAKHHYSADSARDPHPLLLTAAGCCMPPDGVAARMASAQPLYDTGVTHTSIIRS